MKGFLYKDFILFRAMFIFDIIIAVLLCVTCSVSMNSISNEAQNLTAITICFISFFYCNISDVSFFKHDENPGWFSFVSSTPGAVKMFVQSKFICWFVMNTLVYFIWQLYSAVMIVATNGEINFMSVVSEIYYIFLIISAIEMAFVSRFGTEKGMNIKGYVMLGVLLIVFVYALFGDLSFLKASNILEALLDSVKWLIALLPYIAAAVYVFSYKISCKIYKKGVENFEQ